jgi:hypothetical protein
MVADSLGIKFPALNPGQLHDDGASALASFSCVIRMLLVVRNETEIISFSASFRRTFLAAYIECRIRPEVGLGSPGDTVGAARDACFLTGL